MYCDNESLPAEDENTYTAKDGNNMEKATYARSCRKNKVKKHFQAATLQNLIVVCYEAEEFSECSFEVSSRI